MAVLTLGDTRPAEVVAILLVELSRSEAEEEEEVLGFVRFGAVAEQLLSLPLLLENRRPILVTVSVARKLEMRCDRPSGHKRNSAVLWRKVRAGVRAEGAD